MKFFAKKQGALSKLRQFAGLQVAERLDATPGAVRMPIDGIQFYHHDDFLDAAQCERLMAMIDASRRPSTLLATHAEPGFRTSESCDMDRWSPDVRPIDEGIAQLLGIDPLKGETMQGQRYAPGQHFRAHHDYFHEGEAYWKDMQKVGGQRTWTAMIYLNDVIEGGATWFPQAGIKVSPKRGLLLAWNNMRADGGPNTLTIHEGMPVVSGVKYIVTKWFREENWIR
ncbi:MULTISPECIES: 2OG-Fe(II) oxygenase [unclassified Sphingomonas]|uniref:prolyl hydroxylase family protein n=1 Tax=unclassified Sphingomonas TaxID=196159 RepID=UPI00226A963B|nr:MULTISPECIES: 2OG-Fe(II) oxygenase [unclassified Sphingomonas]